MKRAFTLIELLVVIAIIAILAAILFPVFAQAKAAAKKTASLSNVKQIMTSSLIYGSDADDVITPMTSWGAPGVNNGAYVYFNNQGCMPWTQIMQPYMKNVDLLSDPQAPAESKTPAWTPTTAYKLFGPQYGLNPYLNQNVSFPFPTTSPTVNQPRSYTAVSRVADTVMFTQKYSTSETAQNTFYGSWWFGPNTYFITLSADTPDCEAPGNAFYCAAGWNDNGFYGGTGGTKELKNVEAAGAWTGGGSLRGAKRMVVSYVDGHAATKAPGALAEGTAYNNGMSNGIPTQKSSAVTITDITREHYYGLQ